jgi:N-acetylneuraminate synthase
MIRQAAATGKPVLLSSGMSSLEDLAPAVDICRAAGAPVALFQCSTFYPCPPEKAGLNVLADMRERFRCPVGLSDHSGQIFAGLAATTLGASLVETHVTFSRQMFGPDAPASLTFPELRQLADGMMAIHKMLSHPLDKAALAAELAPTLRVFQKCVVARRALPAGTVLGTTDLALKKAGGGLSPAWLERLVGRRLARDLAPDEPVQEADLSA